MSEVIGVIALFVPLFFIMLLANGAQLQRSREGDYQALAIGSYVLIALLYLLMLGFGLAILGLVVVVGQQPDIATTFQETMGAEFPLRFESLPLLGYGLLAPSVAGLALLLPPVRRAVAHVIPVDAQNPVHAVALSLSMLVVVNLLFTLGIGLENLAEVLAAQAETGGQSTTMVSLWTQQLLTAAFAMVGVGWLTRRRWSAVLERLGITGVTLSQFLIGVGLGLAMVPVVMLLELASTLVGVGSDPSVERLTEQLLGSLVKSPLGIITLGVSAAIGEETLFRGAVQPRFGLVLTAFLFALLHSNYGITLSTGIVFILGLVLGLVRVRMNTTTAMVVHAVYNMALGLIAYLSLSFFDV